jgi:AbrB family looped-hinge helix DNA binding protein
MKTIGGTFTSKGQLVVPAELRRKHGIEAGTRVTFLEDQFGRIVLQPVSEKYVDRVMGCLSDGPDLVAQWEREHRLDDESADNKRATRRKP